jgi:rRNA-processing protein FCF1
MEELDEIIARGKKEGQAAKLAKMILMTKRVTVIPTEGGHTDNLLLDKADENNIIATMDKALKQRLKRKKQDVVIMRGENRLAVVGA